MTCTLSFETISSIMCTIVTQSVFLCQVIFMAKKHITARIDENVMNKISKLLKKYKGMNMAQVIEIAILSLLDLPEEDREKILAHYLLQGLKKPLEKE